MHDSCIISVTLVKHACSAGLAAKSVGGWGASTTITAIHLAAESYGTDTCLTLAISLVETVAMGGIRSPH